MNQTVQKRINEWTSSPFDAETIGEIQQLLDQNNEKELMDRFHAMLEFGTGGLRGVLGAGTNRMNIYTVGMAAQGLANYIVKKGRAGDGVVVAYDSRRMSNRFKEEVASIMAGNGIRAYVFDDISPTPMCSFAIRQLKAVSGIVITASHNPPEYNGFKAYWDDGGQVVPPQDEEIINEVKAIDSISDIKKIPYADGITSGIITIIGEDILKSYMEKLEKKTMRPSGESDIKIVYSPLHGTGYKIVPRVLAHFGFGKVIPVKEQSVPDENFSTVKSPNPEERAALEMSLDLARRENADIIMATDPDGDRMGVGFRDESGDYLLINGNQIGTMLEYYLLSRLSSEGKLPQGATVIKTIVTTDLQEEIAKSFGCKTESVLTGFKWIALKMREYDSDASRSFVFGGEESYGYLPVDFVRDKDAVSACYFFAEMADWLKSRGMSLNDFLNEIYVKHHLYLEDLHSLTLKGMEGMEKIGAIMNALRQNPPKEFAAREVTCLSDLKALTMKDMKTGSEHPMEGLPSSDVLQFFLDDGSKITMRPSGTEPKIKFYFSVKAKTSKEKLEAAKEELKIRIEAMKKSLLDRIT